MRKDWEALSRELQKRVQERLDLSREQSDQEVLALIDEEILKKSGERYLLLDEKLQLQKELFNSMRRLDMLQELIEDPDVTEIMVNGPRDIFVERGGRLTRWEGCFSSREKLEDVVQQMVSFCNRSISKASPIADARLADGSRVNIVLDPVALNGPVVTIRRFPKEPIRMRQLLEWGSISPEAVSFLQKAVQAGYNIFVSGGTGSGKTTALNALSEFIPMDERIITIEDNAELQLDRVENLVTLEARSANPEGEREITIRDLIKTSLRMRPDRIIVGEIRGAEAIDMLQAMNTGHDGSLSTGHANSPADMLSRLETMVLMGMELPLTAVRRQIASGLDLIVHLGRVRDGSRKILEIVEIEGMDRDEIRLRTLFSFEEEKGKEKTAKVVGQLQKKADLLHTEKLRAAGIGGL
ncbi:CpaF family protein [Candidatus Merdisoma sp. HCP28S3_D10]|uniref:CpaF family protein n=1 Tax=unclassified Candidatus Merdisoma TaxID=3099611 RepID=UPI003F8992D4